MTTPGNANDAASAAESARVKARDARDAAHRQVAEHEATLPPEELHHGVPDQIVQNTPAPPAPPAPARGENIRGDVTAPPETA